MIIPSKNSVVLLIYTHTHTHTHTHARARARTNLQARVILYNKDSMTKARARLIMYIQNFVHFHVYATELIKHVPISTR